MNISSTSSPLLAAALRVLQGIGAPKSVASLMRGIPHAQIMTPELLVRACENANLRARVLEMQFSALQGWCQPLILELRDEVMCVAVYEPGSPHGTFIVYGQDGEKLEQAPSQDELGQAFTGRCIELETKPQAGSMNASFSAWLWRMVHSQRSALKDVLVASLLVNLFALATPLFTMNIYDRVVPNQAFETLWVLAAGMGLVLIFDLLLKFARHYLIHAAGHQLELALSARLLQRILGIKMQHVPGSVGALASQFREFESLRHLLSASSLITMVDLPFALLFLLLIYLLGGPVVWVALVASILLVLLGLLTHWRLHYLSRETQEQAALKQSVLVETLASLETLKGCNAQARAQGLWDACVARLADVTMQSRARVDRLSAIAQVLMQAAVIGTLIVGVYQVNAHQLSLGALIACVLLASRAMAPMLQLAHISAQWWQAKQAVKGLDGLYALPQEAEAGRQHLHRESWEGKLAFEDLSFAYESGKPILRGLNITIQPGEHVAFIGRVGSGKTSLFRLLMGFIEAERGRVRVDGLDVRHLDMVDLRNAIGYVPQEVRLVKGSLRDNLALKRPLATDVELLQAAGLAGLTEMINAHELGLDMPVGENGIGLSGGQKQALAIARALVGEPRILLFDELTSAMDNQTEQDVIANIKQYSAGRTLLLSTHRSALLALVDRVIVLDQGRVLADGPKAKVLDALKKGLIKTRDNAAGEKA